MELAELNEKTKTQHGKAKIQAALEPGLVLLILDKIGKVMDTVNVPYWFATGTALGLARTGRCMEYDADIDFEIWSTDYTKLNTILQEMAKEGFVHLSFNDYKGRIEQVGWKYKNIFVDVTFKHLLPKTNQAWCTSRCDFPDGTTAWIDKIYPANLFQSVDYINAYDYGLFVPVPSNLTEYLRLTYGEDWRTPQPDYWTKNGYFGIRECVNCTINKDIS